MAISEQDRAQFVNEVGYEAFQHIVKRMEELGPISFEELFPSVVGASTVCLANVLGTAIENAPHRASVADSLMMASWRQLKTLLDPIVEQQQPGENA
ncbi:MAG: hypothetical protein EOO26_09750 [Comamonadaceae bacterium]|nr:MAG: hypothetical protein EOO26_09750 [Comamonadaceae bacterium]